MGPIASPTDAKFIYQRGTKQVIPTNRSAGGIHSQPTGSRRACAVKNPAEGTWDIAQAVRIAVADPKVIGLRRVPIEASGVAVAIVRESAGIDKVIRVQRAARRSKVRSGNQPQDLG